MNTKFSEQNQQGRTYNVLYYNLIKKDIQEVNEDNICVHTHTQHHTFLKMPTVEVNTMFQKQCAQIFRNQCFSPDIGEDLREKICINLVYVSDN